MQPQVVVEISLMEIAHCSREKGIYLKAFCSEVKKSLQVRVPQSH